MLFHQYHNGVHDAATYIIDYSVAPIENRMLLISVMKKFVDINQIIIKECLPIKLF